MTSTCSAADTGLPSKIITFLMSPPPAKFEPGRQQFEAAFVALCLSWQFAHLDDVGMDRAIEELVRRNRCGAATIIQENVAAIRMLYTSTATAEEKDSISSWNVSTVSSLPDLVIHKTLKTC